MRIIFLISTIILLTVCNVLAEDFHYPNSSDFNYPEYEVKLLDDHFLKLNKTVNQNLGEDAFINYVINYNYNINSYSKKLFSIIIINSLSMELRKNTKNLSKNEIAQNFISKYELLDDYSDDNIWKKFIVWIVMRKSKGEKTSDHFISRRCQLLESIIKNNPKYAALSSYLLNMVELYWPNTSPQQVEKDMVFLNKFIYEDYPNTEFAFKASTLLINKYIYLKNYDQAVLECQKFFKNTDNFFTGVSDIYFDVYREMLVMYRELNQPDKIKFIIEKLNQNSKGYRDIVYIYSKCIK